MKVKETMQKNYFEAMQPPQIKYPPPHFLQNKITKFCSERILLFSTFRYYSNFLSKGCTYKYIKQNSFYGLLHQRSGSGSAAEVRPGLGSESRSAYKNAGYIKWRHFWGVQCGKINIYQKIKK